MSKTETDKILADRARGLAKYLELYERHRGPLDDAMRKIVTDAFEAGCEWGTAIVIRTAARAASKEKTQIVSSDETRHDK